MDDGPTSREIIPIDSAPCFMCGVDAIYRFAEVDAETRQLLEAKYFGKPLIPNSYRDALLLEELDFGAFQQEMLNPSHGHSNFHIGHENPGHIPKHSPDNISWRTHRSNLIQGNMTLREARIYIVKLIGRYFELGEIDVT